jgi:NADPH:quinone reductase-like Zn-dependent oxidoreductase
MPNLRNLRNRRGLSSQATAAPDGSGSRAAPGGSPAGSELLAALVPETMTAVLLTGHGGLDRLQYRTDVPVPRPESGEVLIEVAAAGINNTDINTRIGWYSKKVTSETNDGGVSGFASVDDGDASWSGTTLDFPRIQGADVCGRIVAVGDGVSAERIGERVLVRTMLRGYVDYRPFACWTFGSECDGGFAQYAVAPACDTYAVDCDWSDAELAAIPCAYSTAENMLHRAAVGAERVLVTGASGGVGLAAVQLAKRRGATVVAVCSAGKAPEVKAQGADRTLERGTDPVAALGAGSVDVVIDLVGGPHWPQLPGVLRRGGRYAIAGAIGGPIAEIDLRTVYLKDLTLYGCTFQTDDIFEDLVTYIERGEIRPVISGTYPLSDIARAQEDFLAKKHTGKLVLIPPATAK